jgi:hypothetical protein
MISRAAHEAVLKGSQLGAKEDYRQPEFQVLIPTHEVPAHASNSVKVRLWRRPTAHKLVQPLEQSSPFMPWSWHVSQRRKMWGSKDGVLWAAISGP